MPHRDADGNRPVPESPVSSDQADNAQETVDLSSNENVLGAAPSAVAAAVDAVRSAHRYPERQPAALTERLAALHGVGPDQIMVGNGAQHVLRVIAATFLRQGDTSLGLDPTYPGYRNAAQSVNSGYVAVPALDGGYGNLEAWVAHAHHVRLAWLCTPNNPTGCILFQSQARTIMEALPEDAIVVFDETYRDFVTDDRAVDGVRLLHAGSPVIVVRTFSKLYGLAGLRIGYAITTSDHVAAMLKRLDSFPVNQAAAPAALAALDAVEHIEDYRRLVLEGRAYLQDEFKRLGVLTFASEANFVTAYFGDASTAIVESVQEAGYAIRMMSGQWGLPGWVRVTVGRENHNAAVIRAIEVAMAREGTVRTT